MGKDLLDFFKYSSKTGDRFTAISGSQTNEDRVSFHLGNILDT